MAPQSGDAIYYYVWRGSHFFTKRKSSKKSLDGLHFQNAFQMQSVQANQILYTPLHSLIIFLIA